MVIKRPDKGSKKGLTSLNEEDYFSKLNEEKIRRLAKEKEEAEKKDKPGS